MKTNHFIILATVGIVGFATLAFSQTDMPDDKPGIISWLKNKMGGLTITEITIQQVTVHCKVVDQNGAPVPNAQMEIGRKYTVLPDFYNPVVEHKWITADDAGVVKFDIKLHQENNIWEIKKKGYEPGHFTESPYYGATQEQKNELFKNSSTTPLIFTLRKLGPTTYLQHDARLEWYFDQPNEFVVYDLFVRGFDAIDRDLSKLRAPWRRDLIFDVTKDGGNYTVKVLPVQETGTMQFLDQLLYEAPADGYQPEATMTITNGEERTTYLYFTSRKPPVYSRMKIELIASEEKLIFRYDTWTNPYGSRNLEYEPDLPADLLIKLMDEAEKALKSGKLPPEPDIPAMIASGLYN